MVKLSDALRGAADRAPLDGISISTDAAARRVRAHRGLRNAATGVVGATAIAVVALGVIGPQATTATEESAASDREMAMAEAAPDASGADGYTDMSSGATGLAFGVCGQMLPQPSYAVVGDVALTAEVPGEVDPGETLPIRAITTMGPRLDEGGASADGAADVVATAPGAYVLWGDVVVASMPQAAMVNFGPADEPVENLEADPVSFSATEGTTQEFALDVPLNNCWDGEPLPAGTYHLVLTQEVYQDIAPLPTTTPSPDASPSAAASPSAENGDQASTDLVVEPSLMLYGYDQSEVATFAVVGEPADNPFADYLGMPVTPGEPPVEPTVPPVDPPTDLPQPTPIPDGMLTPDVARQMYQLGLTTEPWDMAEGTQRWLITSDSTVPYQDDTWANSYFGCGMDSQTGGRFPAQSSTMELLDVNGELPRRIGLSYGWVVDDNPEFTLSARNVSDFTLSNFAPTLNSQLYLVKDGVVVAESWGVSPNPNGGVVMYGAADMARQGAAELRDAGALVGADAYQSSTLSPGGSVGSTFLWRDVQGCWSGDKQAPVRPGVYTLVSSQYVPVGAPQMYLMEDAARLKEGLEGDASFGWTEGSGTDSGIGGLGDGESFPGAGTDGANEIAIAPVPDPAEYDAVDLQVWTSFGTITVN